MECALFPGASGVDTLQLVPCHAIKVQSSVQQKLFASRRGTCVVPELQRASSLLSPVQSFGSKDNFYLKEKKKGNKRVLALISAYVTASHRAEARSLRKLSLHCPCCWVTVSAPHMTPNDNYKLHLKMLNGAGIAGRWRCCLCLSVWALEQGSLQTHLTPSQSFHGIWT